MREEFVKDIARLIRYAFKDSVTDFNKIDIFYDRNMHRQMRCGFYCWYWPRENIQEFPIKGTSMDFTLYFLLKNNILPNISLWESQVLVEEITYHTRVSEEPMISQDECDEIFRKYITEEE